MKLGAHIYLWTDRWSDDRLDLIDSAAALGLDYLELSVGDDVEFTPSLTRERAESLGLELSVGPGGVWPKECDLSSPDPERRRKGFLWHRQVIDLTVEVGAAFYAGALYGHPGVVDCSNPPEAAYPCIAEALHDLAEHARRRGVGLMIEPMSRFRTHVANTPEQAVRLVKMAAHPNLQIVLDTYHMVTEVRDYGEAVRRCGDRLGCVHACENDRGVPGGGLVQWQRLFDALLDGGFDGYMGMETYNTSLTGFALSRGIFQDLCPDGDEFVRRGLSFLKQQIAAARNRAGRGG